MQKHAPSAGLCTNGAAILLRRPPHRPDTCSSRQIREIAEIASRQHGVISAAQLAAAGVSADQRQRMLAAGRLHRLHRGIYAVGHTALTRRSRWLAAVLATGGDALLACRSAAQLHGLLTSKAYTGPIEILRPGHARRIPGVTVSRRRAARRLVVDGVPTTSVARTLVDLASVLDVHALEVAAEQAEFKRALDPRQVLTVIEGWSGAPAGIGNLRAVLGDERLNASQAGSMLERRALAILLEAGLPRPRLQSRFVIGQPAKQIRVDMHWPQANLVVEIDGPHHERPLARLRDAERDAGLRGLGLTVLRISYRQIEDEPASVAPLVARFVSKAAPSAD